MLVFAELRGERVRLGARVGDTGVREGGECDGVREKDERGNIVRDRGR